MKYARLSMAESIKLSHWLAKQEKMPYRIEDLIKEVRVQLEMNVTATSLTSIMEATGIKLAEKPAKRKYQFYSPLLAQEIMRIQTELGMKINPDLAALAKEKVR